MLATTTHPSSCQRLSYLLINPFIVNPTASSKLITNTLLLLLIYKNNYHGRLFSAQQENKREIHGSLGGEGQCGGGYPGGGGCIHVEEAIRVEEAVGKRKTKGGLQPSASIK